MIGRLPFKKIGVLMGGLSAEREISLKTGETVLASLKAQGYSAVGIDVDEEIAGKIKKEKIDLAFIALHGPMGEDGAIQGLLEVLHVPYTGSGILASALGINKLASRKVFVFHKLAVPEFKALRRGEEATELGGPSGFPVVVKPNSQGSSFGVSIIQRPEDLSSAIEVAFKYDSEILIEKYIEGQEVHIGILGDKVLGAIEILPSTSFYDYEAKYTPGMSTHIFPARLSPEIYQKTLDHALVAHRALGCRGYSRVDMVVDKGGIPFILELNTLPGMTQTSLLPEIAREVGITFDVLIHQILALAMKAHRAEQIDLSGGSRP
jgi:D-alanine-D-alanine ligase